ncbi:MAG TPA: M20/M25/M40 family metallo-hydrolase [Thermoanaerobaculia bacterium]|nr:M20/M25/M40 family metallo-hydrolase [Thermoanaerobaculia bacterium]
MTERSRRRTTPRARIAARALGSGLLVLAAGALSSAPPANPAVPAMPRASAIRDQVRAYRVRHDKEIVKELADWVSLRNVAVDRADIERNAQALVQMLGRRGIEARLLTAGDSPPAVYGELRAAGARRTVVFYAHYDGQPADPADWKSDPWRAVLRSGPLTAKPRDIDLAAVAGPLDGEWRLFARSASDDKGPIVGMLVALDALRAAGIAPAVNLKFFFEGEEEAGSPHLTAILESHHDLLAADAWVLADGPEHQSGRMQVCFGARGASTVEVTVYGPVRALHDGHYGNWAPNPAALLVQLLASVRGPQGEILIHGFNDEVRPLSDSELRAAAEMPPVEEALERELGLAWTEGGGARLQEAVMRPALNLRGLKAAQVGKQGRNAVPTEASASIDFRLVPDQTPAKVRARFEEHLRQAGYYLVDKEPDLATRRAHARIVRLEWELGYPGARTSMDLPASRAVLRTAEEGVGGAVIKVPMLGGSIPMYLFTESLAAPVIIVPTVNYDNSQHAADENLRLQNLWDGIELFATLFVRLGNGW